MSSFSVGVGFLVAGLVFLLLHLRLLYINGIIDPKPLIIKPTLLEEDKLNNTKKFTTTIVVHNTQYESYRNHLSADYGCFLTFFMWGTALASVICLSIGMANFVEGIPASRSEFIQPER